MGFGAASDQADTPFMCTFPSTEHDLGLILGMKPYTVETGVCKNSHLSAHLIWECRPHWEFEDIFTLFQTLLIFTHPPIFFLPRRLGCRHFTPPHSSTRDSMTSGRHLFPLCPSVLGSFWYVFESGFFPEKAGPCRNQLKGLR